MIYSFYSSGQAFGIPGACRKAVIPEAAPEKRKALEALMKTQTGADFAFTPQAAAAVTVLRIELEEITAKARNKKL